MRYVIVGGGIAGTTAAEELRKRDADAEITIVSEEFHPLYSRVLLPHYLKGKVPRERVFLKKEEWYGEQDIEWLPGTFVTKLDVNNKFVLLSDGREVEYDKLLIATGGEPRPLPEDRRGVFYLQTVDDADHLMQLVREPGSEKAIVYGGGFIAAEFINLFFQYKIQMTIACRGKQFWSHTLGSSSWDLIRTKLENSGIKVRTEVADLDLVRTEGIVGVGIGLVPELSWVREAGIEVGQGVKTNEYLETSVPDVYAAGDVAEFMDISVGRQHMAGNWMSAQMQGRAVAGIMSGERTPFVLVSSYATNVLELQVVFVGDVSREDADEVRELGDAASGIIQLFGRGGKLVGASLVGRVKERQMLTTAIQNKLNIMEITVN